MKFTYITLFPELIKGYFGGSILKRALENKYINIDFINPRDFSTNKHHKIDYPQAGGGAGMLISSEPIHNAILSIKDVEMAHIVFLLPSAKLFTQNDAKRLAQKKHIVFVSGRYEGIDDRVIEDMADEVFCIGDYILTGGELPSLVLSDAICRNIPKVLGNKDSLEEESFENRYLEAPSFTKPNIFNKISIPSAFLKGNHAKIAILKSKLSKIKTKYFRPDIYKQSK